MNSWLEKLSSDDLYMSGIRQLLEILDEKHLIDQLLQDSLEERITNWMKDVLFKRETASKTESYARLSVICLHLHPTLVEGHLAPLIQQFVHSEQSLSVFLVGYVDLYARMRSLAKLTKRLTAALDKSVVLPTSVLHQYGNG